MGSNALRWIAIEGAALAMHGKQILKPEKMSNLQISQPELETLAQAGVIPHGTPKPILEVFAITCSQHSLSPFKKEIYLVKYGQQYSTIVGIDGLRAKASRTGCFAGRDDARFDVQPDGTYKTASQLKTAKAVPSSATVTIYKMVAGQRCPFTKTVVFAEYCPATPTNKWLTMPFNMIEKCAEAAAIRMGFADETAGLHIEEESAAMQDITIHAAKSTPSVAIDETALKSKIDSSETNEDLVLLYGSNPAYKAFASLFTARKEEILDAQQLKGELV